MQQTLGAVLAAVFSGVTLLLSWRRDALKWIRDTTRAEYTNFLHASFRRQVVAQRMLRAHNRGELTDALRNQLTADEAAAHDEQQHQLTAIRLLSPSEVVGAAETVIKHVTNLAFAVIMERDLDRLTAERWTSYEDSANAARMEFLNQARKAIRVSGGGAEIQIRSRWVFPRSEEPPS